MWTLRNGIWYTGAFPLLPIRYMHILYATWAALQLFAGICVDTMPPDVDPLVRVRGSMCQEECHVCAAAVDTRPVPGAERERCLRAIPCARRVSQQHGYGCCKWEARDNVAAAMEIKSAAEIDVVAFGHSAELFRRLRWCIDQGPSHWPANAFVHLAPGDDAAFPLGIPPVR